MEINEAINILGLATGDYYKAFCKVREEFKRLEAQVDILNGLLNQIGEALNLDIDPDVLDFELRDLQELIEAVR